MKKGIHLVRIWHFQWGSLLHLHISPTVAVMPFSVRYPVSSCPPLSLPRQHAPSVGWRRSGDVNRWMSWVNYWYAPASEGLLSVYNPPPILQYSTNVSNTVRDLRACFEDAPVLQSEYSHLCSLSTTTTMLRPADSSTLPHCITTHCPYGRRQLLIVCPSITEEIHHVSRAVPCAPCRYSSPSIRSWRGVYLWRAKLLLVRSTSRRQWC